MGEVSVGSFPRSGNHFLVKVLRILFPELKVNWIEHNIWWLSVKPNVITIVRNPVDCVYSWINFTKDTRINRADKILEWYCEYQNKCIELKNSICIVDFNKLTADVNSTIKSICLFYDIKEVPDFDLLPPFDEDFCNKVSDEYDKLDIEKEIISSPYYTEALFLYKKVLNISD